MVNNRYDPAQILGDIEDVDLGTAADNQILQYNSATGNWEATLTPDGLTMTGLTVSGNFAWTGNATLDASSGNKIVAIPTNGGFEFFKSGRSWFSLITATNTISFGNAVDNPVYNFLGTGPLATGGGRKVNETLIDDTDSPYTVLASDHEIFVDTDTAAVTINLPAGVAGTKYRIINTGSSGNDVTVAPNGAELLTGANASRTLSDSSVIILTYNAVKGWW